MASLGKFAQKNHHRTSEYVNFVMHHAYQFSRRSLVQQKEPTDAPKQESSPVIGALITARAHQFLDISIRGRAYRYIGLLN